MQSPPDTTPGEVSKTDERGRVLVSMLLVTAVIVLNSGLLGNGWAVGILCGAGAALAVRRIGLLRRWMPQLDLFPVVFVAGAAILSSSICRGELQPPLLTSLLWMLGWLGWVWFEEVWPARLERARSLVILVPALATFLALGRAELNS
jgi:hypothetical protein